MQGPSGTSNTGPSTLGGARRRCSGQGRCSGGGRGTVVPSAGWRFACQRRWDWTFLAGNVQGQRDCPHNGGVGQRRLAGRRRDQLKMRMVATVVRARHLRAGVVVVGRRGVGRAMVFSGVMVREAMNHLWQEEAYPKEKGEQDDREAGATQVPHRVKITRLRHRGSRRDSFSGKPAISGWEGGHRCSVSARFRATRTGRATSNSWLAVLLVAHLCADPADRRLLSHPEGYRRCR